MDVNISRWVLEFLAFHPRVSDNAVRLALSMLPLSDGDPFFTKSMVLRSIQSEIDEASISEKLLNYIEVVEEIDRNAGLPIAESMKEAYCTVAVECCIRYIHGPRLEKLGKFAEAVRRIWTGRIRVMEQSPVKNELLTPKLLQWGHRIEAAVGDQSECLNLMMINTRTNAFRAVEGYVTYALEKMRPSFLETIAACVGPEVHLNPSEEISLANDIAESAGQADAQVNRQERSIPLGHGEEISCADRRAESDVQASQQERSIPLGRGEEISCADRRAESDVQVSQQERSIPLGHGEEIRFSDHRAESDARVSPQERSIPLGHGEGLQIEATEASRQAKGPVEVHELRRNKHPPRYKRKTAGPVLRSMEDSANKAMGSEYDFIPSPDVDKVQDALRSSSSELQAVVEDPLPEALRVAKSFGSASANDSAQEKTRKVVTTKDADSNTEVNPPIMEENCPNEVSNRQNDVQRPTLMERKNSARIDEWEGSSEDSVEELTSDAERPMLSSRKRRAISPLRMPPVPRLSRRRQKKRWSTEEEDALRRGVQRFGKGNWKVILNCYSSIFDERNEVDLKDKWRNLNR